MSMGNDNKSELPWKELALSLTSFDTVKAAVLDTAGHDLRGKKIVLACDEAFSNIVEYSGAEHCGFYCLRSENNVEIGFADDGIEFDPTKHEPAEKFFEEMDSGGMGISLIRQTVSSWDYRRENDKNILVMLFR